MNARSMQIDVKMEGRQVDEVVASLFHTVLFHRSCGKFLYKNEESYSIGTIGYMDVDCDYIDFTYVCCSSEALNRTIKREISGFSELLRAKEGSIQGAISLEFFQKRRTRWPFQPECVPWEVWTVRCAVQKMSGEDERQSARETVSELLQERVLFITEIVNQHEYVPKMPTRSDIDLIFDTSYDDVQPYLFKMHYSLGPGSGATVGNTVKKLIRETLAF